MTMQQQTPSNHAVSSCQVTTTVSSSNNNCLAANNDNKQAAEATTNDRDDQENYCYALRHHHEMATMKMIARVAPVTSCSMVRDNRDYDDDDDQQQQPKEATTANNSEWPEQHNTDQIDSTSSASSSVLCSSLKSRSSHSQQQHSHKRKSGGQVSSLPHHYRHNTPLIRPTQQNYYQQQQHQQYTYASINDIRQKQDIRDKHMLTKHSNYHYQIRSHSNLNSFKQPLSAQYICSQMHLTGNYEHPVGELRLVCKLIDGGIRSRNGCKCLPCRRHVDDNTNNNNNNNKQQYLNVHSDGQHLSIENPFELKQQQQQSKLCNRFKFETIVDCRQKSQQQQLFASQSSKFDLMIKSLVKSFVIHGTDACLVSLGNDSGQTQSTMLGPCSNYYPMAASDGGNNQDLIIQAVIPKSMIYCYQLIDRLKLEQQTKTCGAGGQQHCDINYQINLKCCCIVVGKDRPNCCVYDLLQDDLAIIQNNQEDSFLLPNNNNNKHLSVSTIDSLYRNIDARQAEKHCSKLEDFMDILQLVWLRYNELCQLADSSSNNNNMIMKVTLTKTSTSNSGGCGADVFASSSRFCLFDLHPSSYTNQDHLMSAMLLPISSRNYQQHHDSLTNTTTILMSFLRAHLNGALTKSLVLVHLSDCEMTFNNNIDLAKFALIMQQSSTMRLQRRKRFVRMFKQQQQQQQNNSNNNRCGGGGSSNKIHEVATSGLHCGGGGGGSSSLASQSSSIDTVIYNTSPTRHHQLSTKERLSGKVDLNALLLSPRRFLARSSHHDNDDDDDDNSKKRHYQQQQFIDCKLHDSRSKLYMIDCECPAGASILHNDRSIQSSQADNRVNYSEPQTKCQSPRAETPPFPMAPSSIHNDLARYCNITTTTTTTTKRDGVIDVDIQSQSESLSDVVAEPPKQLKLEQFLQQLTTIIATPLKQQSDDTQEQVNGKLWSRRSSSTSLSQLPLPTPPPPLPPPQALLNNDDDDCCSHSSIMNHLSFLTTTTTTDHRTGTSITHLDNNNTISGGTTTTNDNNNDNNNNRDQLYTKIKKPTPVRSSSSCEDDKACSTSSGCSSCVPTNNTNRFHNLRSVSGVKKIDSFVQCSSMDDDDDDDDEDDTMIMTTTDDNRLEPLDVVLANNNLSLHASAITCDTDSGVDKGKLSSTPSSGHHSESEDIDHYGSIQKSSCSLLCCRLRH